MKLRKILAVLLLASMIASSSVIPAAAAEDQWPDLPPITAVDTVITGDYYVGTDIVFTNQNVVIDGNIMTSASIAVEGGSLTITGNVNARGGSIIAVNGSVNINGDLTVSGVSFRSRYEDETPGLITVGGNMIVADNGADFTEGNVEVAGDLTQTSNINCGKDGVLTVKGNFYHRSNTLNLSGGTVNIGGNYEMRTPKYDSEGKLYYAAADGALKMQDENGYMKVGGDFYIQPVYGNSKTILTNGTLELQGNFSQNGADTAFDAKDNHKVYFTGTKTQTVTFNSSGSSGFAKLITSKSANPDVDIVKGRILSAQTGSTLKNFVQYGNLDLTDGGLTVTGDMTEYGNVTVGGNLTVGGKYTHYNNYLKLAGGKLDIGGDYDMRRPQYDADGKITSYTSTDAAVQMQDENDYMKVGGDFYIYPVYGNSKTILTNGTLELQGNFSQNGADTAFDAKDEHKVIFTGNKPQTVTFNSAGSSGFAKLITAYNANRAVNITKGRILSAQSGSVLSDFVQYGSLDLTDGDLTVTGDMTEYGNVTVGGNLTVGGNYTHYNNYLKLAGGKLDIGGDYDMRRPQYDADGKITSYTSTDAAVQMQDENDYMKVGGDFYIYPVYGNSKTILTNGMLELQGNFTQSGADTAFDAKDEHKVIFTGSKTQTVTFNSAGNSGFAKLLAGDEANPDVVITKGRILTVSPGSVLKSFVQYGKLDLTGADLTVNGDMTENGNVTVGGQLTVKGKYSQYGGYLSLSGGRLDIYKDYDMRIPKKDQEGKTYYASADAAIQMQSKSDYMKVRGNFYIQPVYGNSHTILTNGTLELKGNFTQSGADTAFDAKDNHKVYFTGTKTQTVTFNSPGSSGFAKLITTKTANPDVDIVKGRILTAQTGSVLKNFVQYGSLDLTGGDLTVTGDMTEYGNVTVGGNLTVGGKYTHYRNYLKLAGGRLDIGGDYDMRQPQYDDDGKITSYTSTDAAVQMQDENDYMKVGGDFYFYPFYGNSHTILTNGTLELQGNFTQGGAETAFDAAKEHKVVFTGDKKQTVVFGSPGSSGFGTLLYTDSSNPDVDIKGRILAAQTGAKLSNFKQYGQIDLTGSSLEVDGDMTQNGKVTVGGNLNVKGSYLHHGGSLYLSGGKLDISGNYELRSPKYDEEGNIVSYSSASADLHMTHPNDYMKVGGDFYTQPVYGDSDNVIRNGTLELQGDFTQGGASTAFKAYGNHKTILTGNKSQNIVFTSKSSYFNYLLIALDKDPADTFSRPGCATHPLIYSSVVNLSQLETSTTYKGGSVTLNAQAVGGIGPYVYVIVVKAPDGSETYYQPGVYYGLDFEIKAEQAGTYEVTVAAVDVNNEHSDVTLTFEAEDLEEFVNNSTVDSAKAKPGEKVTMRAEAKGGKAPYKYAYYYKKQSDNNWKTLGYEFGSSNTYDLSIKDIGVYDLKIVVKDDYGQTAEKLFTLEVKEEPVVNDSTVASASVTVGEKIVIKGAASGGEGPYTYAYYYKRAENTSWKKIGTEFTEKTSAELTPTSAAVFDVKTIVKDSSGQQVEKTFKVTVNEKNTLNNTSVINSDKVQVGDKVRIAASANGGSGSYTYAYYYKRSTNTGWKTLGTEWGTTSSVAFAPTAEADYDIKVIVKDSQGNKAEKLFTVTAFKELELTNVSVVGRTSVNLGTAIPMVGKAVGGKAPYTYSFYFKRSTNTNWKLLGDKFSTTASARFKPTATGTYDIRIDVKDSSGNVVKRLFTATVK